MQDTHNTTPMSNTDDLSLQHYSEDARDRVAAMSLQEKAGLMTGRNLTKLLLPLHYLVFKQYNRAPYPNNPVKRLGVPALKFCDGPRGVVSGESTCFPVAMARGATFDVDLERRVGNVIGKEVIAAGGNFFAGVCINLLRHPAWGRAQEVYGEDPHLLGQMGVAITESVQALGVMACLKHFAMNSMENARFKVNVTCSERTLHEVYLPHFKDCVDAGAASVMSAYNQVQGNYCGQNKKLLHTILKEEWGFSGFVITDFIWGIYDTVAAAQSGLDVEMPWPTHYGKKLVKAVKSGQLADKYLDEAAQRITSTTLRFDAILKNNVFDKSIVACEEHRELARLVAEKAMTLLKNNDGVLPLNQNRIKHIAVLGRLANAENTGDHGSSKVVPPYVITPLQGIEKCIGAGVKIDYRDGNNIEDAVKVSAEADAVIFVVGNSHSDEGEYLTNSKNSPGGDRDYLGLRPHDVELIRAAAAVNKNSVAILVGGSAITISDWDNEVASIVFAYYPGMEGGTAIANTLFGKAVPGGKLPFTIPENSSHLPFFDKNAETIEYGYYHGYTLLDKKHTEPAYAFGYGLSYTRFELSAPRFWVDEAQFYASVVVNNTGQHCADEVIQLYIGCEESKVDRPVKILRAFKRVTLAPGEEERVTLTASVDSMRWYNEEHVRWELERLPYQLMIGTSSRKRDLLCNEVNLGLGATGSL